jgi:hypothetical protein
MDAETATQNLYRASPEGAKHGFGGDQNETGTGQHGQNLWFDLACQIKGAFGAAQAGADLHDKSLEKFGRSDAVFIVFLMLLHEALAQGHGVDPNHGVLQRLTGGWILRAGGLQTEQAADDLEIVLHPVMDLTQQDCLLLDRIAQRLIAAFDVSA